MKFRVRAGAKRNEWVWSRVNACAVVRKVRYRGCESKTRLKGLTLKQLPPEQHHCMYMSAMAHAQNVI